MESEKAAKVKVPVPPWAWVFVVVCVAIPVVALGGAIPGAIGAGSAGLCYAIAQDAQGRWSARQRVLLCLLVSSLAWAAFGGLWWFTRGRQGSDPQARTSSSGKRRIVREGGKVVYDSNQASKPKRPLSEVSQDERQKIHRLARRKSAKLERAQEELDEAEGRDLRLEQALKKRQKAYAEELEYLADRFRLSPADLDALLAEGDEAGWGD